MRTKQPRQQQRKRQQQRAFVVPKSYHPMLWALSTAKPKVRNLILKSLDAPTIRILAQIAANILHGNIPLLPAQRRKIGRFRRVLAVLRDKYTSIEQKRGALIQQGGFLPFLIPIISSIAGALVSRIASK